jgi:AraC family transcriptional regulator
LFWCGKGKKLFDFCVHLKECLSSVKKQMKYNQIDSYTLGQIQRFAGDITAEQLRFVDFFASGEVMMFLPIAGPCYMAISPMHTHPTPLFVVSFTNTTTVVTKEKRIQSKPNTVCYIPEHQPHHEINENGVPRYVAIMVQTDFLNRCSSLYSSNPVLEKNCISFPASDELLTVIRRFISESKLSQTGSTDMLSALSTETVHLLLRLMTGTQPKTDCHISRNEISRSIEYMRENLSRKLTLDTLAFHAGMSVSQFTRVFRQETGLSPIDYLIDLRLEVSGQMLLSHSFPLKQIAMDCGFSSPAHFSTTFQKRFRMSPSEFLNAKINK